jgi:RNA polymerase sigma-70 factor (ECF subfamily)
MAFVGRPIFRFLENKTVTNGLERCVIAEEQMSTVVTSEAARDLKVIFNEHARLVYRTAYGITGSHEDAEDVLQTVFLQLVRSESPPDLGRNPQAYLYRAAVNCSLNTIRRRRREVLIQDEESLPTPPWADTGNTEFELRRLWQAMAELKPEAAQIVILRYMHNMSDSEIARLLGKSRGAIALKLFRSRARLKKLMLTSLGDK